MESGNRIRVLIFEPYPNPRVLGNLRTLAYIMRLTDPRRFRLKLLIPFPSEFAEYAAQFGVDCDVLEAPIRVNRYGGKLLGQSVLGRLRTTLDLLHYNLSFRSYLRSNPADVVYCNSVRSLLTIVLGAKLSRTPVHLYIKGELANPLLDRICFVLADRIAFFCAANRDDRYPVLVRLFRGKIDIIEIGLDPEEIRAIQQTDKGELIDEFSLRDSVNIAYVGQIYPPKGINFLIDAFGEVAEEFPNARLFVIGHPAIEEYSDYPPALERQAAELGLAERVVFTGWRDDVKPIVALMDVLVHPSLAEGFGRAVLEAMALGRPVIASRLGGLREAIRDGENGFLVEPGDAAAIADRLRLLLGDSELRARLGREAEATVFSRYLIADKIDKLTSVWASTARST